MLIEHISVSRHSIWEECHQKYKYKYHLKVLSPEETPIYFDYGKIIHKIIEKFTINKGKIDINEITKKVLSGEIELEVGKKAPNLPIEYKNKLPEHLRQFMRLTERMGVEGEVELPFRYDLNPPNKLYLFGFIDRLIKKGDQYFVIDYKTTKKGMFRKNRNSITQDLQLQCYSRVVQKEYNVQAKNIVSCLYYLDGGELVGANFSEKTLDEVEIKLLNVYKKIINSNADLVIGKTGDHCRRCEYKTICPFYKIST